MTRWLDDTEATMWRTWRVMWAQLDRVVEQQLANDFGLSGADYALLVPLSEHPEGLRARDLARGASWDRSRLSHQLRRMQQRGLVQRRECPTDARGGIFTLTDAGRAAIETAAPSHVETVRTYFVDLLSPADIATLTRIAAKVSGHLEGDQANEPDCLESTSNP